MLLFVCPVHFSQHLHVAFSTPLSSLSILFHLGGQYGWAGAAVGGGGGTVGVVAQEVGHLVFV